MNKQLMIIAIVGLVLLAIQWILVPVASSQLFFSSQIFQSFSYIKRFIGQALKM